MLAVSEIMTKGVITATPETKIKDAMNILISSAISGLVVVDEEQDVVGVLSEKDLLVAYDLIGNTQSSISDYISREVVYVTEDTPIEEVSRLLVQRNFKQVPVLCGTKVVGIVSRRDILKHIYNIS